MSAAALAAALTVALAFGAAPASAEDGAWSSLRDAVAAAPTDGSPVAVTVSGDVPAAMSAGDRLVVPRGADVTIDLAGYSVEILSPASDQPAVRVGYGSTLTIEGDAPGSALTVRGGAQAAGIGGSNSGEVGTIVIDSGVVNATGGSSGAGIGSGYDGSFGTVKIRGGTVTAFGGSLAAGIGGSGETVAISGGTIIATGGSYGAGIGGGSFEDGGTVTIDGGTITATGGQNGAGIGGGFGNGGTVTITGGTTVATGGVSATAIGHGFGASGNGTLTLAAETLLGGAFFSGATGVLGGTAPAGLVVRSAGYAATFDGAGGAPASAKVFVPLGTELGGADSGDPALPADPVRDHYVFGGWLDGAVPAAFPMPLTGTTTFTASWTPNDHDATFLSNGSTYAVVSVPFGTLVPEPDPAPTLAGHAFAGWWDETVDPAVEWEFAAGTMPAAGLVLTAHWTAHATPGAPADLAVETWATLAHVEWSPPASDGGAAITGYDLVVTRGGTTVATRSLTGTTTDLSSLVPGTEYLVSVTARNAVGTGPAASAGAATTLPAATVEPEPLTLDAAFDLRGRGFDPGAYTVELHSDPVLLGTAAVGTDGDLELSGTIPADVPVGEHELVVAFGGVPVLTLPVVVAAAGALPATGADPIAPVLVGVALLLAGVVLVAGSARIRGRAGRPRGEAPPASRWRLT